MDRAGRSSGSGILLGARTRNEWFWAWVEAEQRARFSSRPTNRKRRQRIRREVQCREALPNDGSSRDRFQDSLPVAPPTATDSNRRPQPGSRHYPGRTPQPRALGPSSRRRVDVHFGNDIARMLRVRARREGSGTTRRPDRLRRRGTAAARTTRRGARPDRGPAHRIGARSRICESLHPHESRVLQHLAQVLVGAPPVSRSLPLGPHRGLGPGAVPGRMRRKTLGRRTAPRPWSRRTRARATSASAFASTAPRAPRPWCRQRA